MLPVIQHAIQGVNIDYNAIMTLQPTSPFRTHIDINNAINIFMCDNEADSLVSVVKVPHNFMPEKLMEYDGKYMIGNNTPKRRQDLKLLYARNGAAIYITKFDKIKSYIFGGNILPYFMDIENSLDIDDYTDWKIAEYLISAK
jgi:CMP-N,N'-diacetyllegionaminic acid synthase